MQSGNQSDFQCKRQRFVLLTFLRPDEEQEQREGQEQKQEEEQMAGAGAEHADGNNLR